MGPPHQSSDCCCLAMTHQPVRKKESHNTSINTEVYGGGDGDGGGVMVVVVVVVVVVMVVMVMVVMVMVVV